MNEAKRETLGAIARLCQQMEYTAMNDHYAMLKAQFDTLRRQMAKLDVIAEYLTKEA